MMCNAIYVLYHAHCTDGTGAKYAAWKKFGDNAQYIPVQYGRPVPKMELGSDVYIVDFSYPRDVLQELQNVHNSVVVLDHHKTAEEALRGLKCCHFDMHKSGCVMAWEYFHPETPVPELLLDIQDRDLWLFKRRHSKAVHAGLAMFEGNMKDWDLAAKGQSYYANMIRNGELMLKREALIIKSAVKSKVKKIQFAGYKCGITNSSDLASEIGNGICLSKELAVDFAVVYCITNDDDVLLSFRSTGDFDVSEIAKKFGGGGHKNASGAKINIETLSKILKGDM